MNIVLFEFKTMKKQKAQLYYFVHVNVGDLLSEKDLNF